MSSIPLANIQKSFFAEGGLRIQNLNPNFLHDDSVGRFEFGTEYLMIQNLEEIVDFFKSKAIYWFDMLGNSDTFLEYATSTGVKLCLFAIAMQEIHKNPRIFRKFK